MLDGVTINQLRAFVAVCDEGSFSGAAKRLSRAQSAISHAITALETALRLELFERNARRATLSPAGRNLLPDARAVISRTEEMKARAIAITDIGVPTLSIAVDAYFPRASLIDCLRTIQADIPTGTINLRMTSMQHGEELVLDGTCAMAITIADVPELDAGAIERHWLGEIRMLTVCAPDHPLAAMNGPINFEEFGRHIQLVVTDNQPGAEKSRMAVAGERQWLLNDLGAKHDFLRAGLGWGHMPAHLVADDVSTGKLVELPRRAWHVGSLTFMISRRRGHDPSDYENRLVEMLGRFGD